MSSAEFHRGSNVAVLGHEVATRLFGFPKYAIGKRVKVKGRYVQAIGVMEKRG